MINLTELLKDFIKKDEKFNKISFEEFEQILKNMNFDIDKENDLFLLETILILYLRNNMIDVVDVRKHFEKFLKNKIVYLTHYLSTIRSNVKDELITKFISYYEGNRYEYKACDFFSMCELEEEKIQHLQNKGYNIKCWEKSNMVCKYTISWQNNPPEKQKIVTDRYIPIEDRY